MARDRKMSADERILWGKVDSSTRPMPGKAGALTE
ncbi:DNA mismatch repair protein MutS, partial [Rhizobium ruizarguesonis]